MNPQRDTLSNALHELAAASPEVSPELGARLGSAFARHHVQRRQKRAALVFGLAACLAIFMYWLRPHEQVGTAKAVAPAPQTAQAPSPEPNIVAPENPGLPAPSIAHASGRPRIRVKPASKPRSHDVERSPAAVEANDFVALSTFDPSIPLGQSRMVRMDMPGSDLQLIGYPVDGALLDHRILTDVLVGQDGMPYAVRIVQARNVQ